MPSPVPTAHPEGVAITTTAHLPGVQTGTRFWPQGWWRLVDLQIGIIPLPVYLILVALLWVLTAEGEIKADAPTMIAVPCWSSWNTGIFMRSLSAPVTRSRS